MKKIILTREEKKELSSLLHFWDEEYYSIESYKEISNSIKLPITLIETMVIHFDNLFILKDLGDQFIFKGGTAVQHYLKSNSQRCSVDLDFNTTIGHPQSVEDLVNDLNNKLQKINLIKSVHEIQFGKLIKEREDKKSGTLTYNRIMPTKLNEFIKVNDTIIQAKKMRIQFNYKHSWLVAEQSSYQNVNLFPVSYIKSKKQFTTNIMSSGDLICDKILTLTRVKDFGRERIKDVYDLVSLTLLYHKFLKITKNKLIKISESQGIKMDKIIISALDHLEELKTKAIEVKGFKSQVGFEGWPIIDKWDKNISKTIAVLDKQLL